jgi:hypothetical protein
MTCLAGRAKPGVIRASPVGQGPSVRQACSRSGPAAWWIRPLRPLPARRLVLAEFTMASAATLVMSVSQMEIISWFLVGPPGGGVVAA